MENKNPQIDKWKRLVKRFGLLWLVAAITNVIITIVANLPGATQDTKSWATPVSISLGVISAAGMLIFLFSLVRLSIAKRRARKEVAENAAKPEKAAPAGRHIGRKLLYAVMIWVLAMFGAYAYFTLVPKTCKDVECFIVAANDDRSANLQSTDKAGIEWSYQIKGGLLGDQTFIKTLVRLDDKEPSFIKNLLEGKSLTCELKGDFDERLVASLFYGVGDNCSGELKENLGQLLFLL